MTMIERHIETIKSLREAGVKLNNDTFEIIDCIYLLFNEVHWLKEKVERLQGANRKWPIQDVGPM